MKNILQKFYLFSKLSLSISLLLILILIGYLFYRSYSSLSTAENNETIKKNNLQTAINLNSSKIEKIETLLSENNQKLNNIFDILDKENENIMYSINKLAPKLKKEKERVKANSLYDVIYFEKNIKPKEFELDIPTLDK